MRKTLAVLVCVAVLAPTPGARASALTPGENPGQYNIDIYVTYNRSDLPLPPAGTRVGTGYLRYDGRWFDQQLAVWRAWLACDYEANGEYCDSLYESIDADAGDDYIDFYTMDEHLKSARFDLYGIQFTESDVKYWTMTYGDYRGRFENIGVVLELRRDDGNSVLWGADTEGSSLWLSLDSQYAETSDTGSCYVMLPDDQWSEDVCYEMDIEAVRAPVREPGTLALLGLGLAGLGLSRRRLAA